MQNLPIGIQSFATVRDHDCLYIDKTALIAELTRIPGRYFLSRPRRFGKSLLVDTIQELFEGNRRLFTGLYIEERWAWDLRYPVVKIDFAGGVLKTPQLLERSIRELLHDNSQRLEVAIPDEEETLGGAFAHLIQNARARYGRPVVVLVDEYDKPILDNIEDLEIAAQMREKLKDLYSVLKSQDAHLQFIFLTGVTKFSKVSLFSGLNQLEDITLNSRYATLCGYTQTDLERDFADHLAGVDWGRLKQMYNGYNFLGEPVYNPYDILLFISNNQSYRHYWFETGSPSFLIKLFQKERYFLPDLHTIEVGEEILDSFDLERIEPVTLLFQAGYLTIDAEIEIAGEVAYRLKIPNREVQTALYNQFSATYTDMGSERLTYKSALISALRQANLPELVATFKRLFAGIPWRNFTQNQLLESEGYYASVLYAFFASLNAQIAAEDITAHGQVDLTVQLEGYTYVVEIKLNREATPPQQGEVNPALHQIQARRYADKYRGCGLGVFEVGLVFSSVARNLVQAEWVVVA